MSYYYPARFGHPFPAINLFRFNCLLFFCLLFFFPLLKSEAIDVVNNLSFDFYSQEQGLSNNQIHCILQDKKGFMWFGTSQGVCRFDGYRFTVFKNNPEDSSSLIGNLVRVIYEDRKGQIWIGTENGGLNKFNRDKENFEHLFAGKDQPVFRDVSVTSIIEDREGFLWVGTETQLYRIENEKTLTEVKPSNPPGFSAYFRVLHIDGTGRMWVGTNNGLFVYDPKTNLSCKVVFPQGYSSDQEIWEIVSDEEGTVWVGTYASGMFTVDPSSLKSHHMVIDPNNDRSNTVRAISKDRNGKYWIGTRGGFTSMTKQRGSLPPITMTKGNPKVWSTIRFCAFSMMPRGMFGLGPAVGSTF